MSENAVEAKQKKRKPVARKDMSKWQWTWKEMKRNYVAYLMCFPFYLIFTVFIVAPVVLSMFFSLTIFNMIEAPQFVGIDNYLRLFLDDDIFIIAVKNTFIFAVITGPVYQRASSKDSCGYYTYILRAFSFVGYDLYLEGYL